MNTPNDRLMEILGDGIEALHKAGDLSEPEYAETKDLLESLSANIDDMRPEDQDEDQDEYQARLDSLTRREREVLAHLINGDRVVDIARLSVVSEGTVRSQVKRILAKLGVTSQLGAVAVAYQARWRPGPKETGHPLPTTIKETK